MLDYVLEAVEAFGAVKTIVVGHCAEEVKQHCADREDVQFALQMPQQGTGHALMQAWPLLDKSEDRTLVCLGDVPLLSTDTVRRMQEEAKTSEFVLLTVNMDNPKGYGRIVRNADGGVTAIVEEKDATDKERLIREVNTGIMLLPTARLDTWLAALRNDNAQQEYYLTDLVGFAAAEGVRISTVQPGHAYEVEGVNSKVQLAALERTWQRVQADRLLEAGVTLIDPDRIDVRGELICGRDVEIDVGCVFEGRVELGDGVRVGAYSVMRNVKVEEDVHSVATPGSASASWLPADTDQSRRSQAPAVQCPSTRQIPFALYKLRASLISAHRLLTGTSARRWRAYGSADQAARRWAQRIRLE